MEFSCCHAFNKCEYGKLECVFASTDPDMKNRCRCYQIKHSPHYVPKVKNEVVPGAKLNNKNQDKEDTLEEVSEMEQLSLF